jgi:glycerol-3-phosphate dehydrogenase
LEDNSLSKAILRVAIDIICRRHSDRVVYFPCFEMLIDDLRDYRFYADDLVHPSKMAVDYIAEKFFAAALSNDTKQLLTRIDKIVQAAHHRPMNPASDKYKSFCQQQLQAIAETKGVDLSKEKQFFEQMLQINL